MNQPSLPSRLFKYFIHGIAFSLLSFMVAVVWIFIFVILVAIGFILGFIIGFIVLFFFVGGLNKFLTQLIWSADIRSDWRSLLIHGFGLFFALLIAGLPIFFLLSAFYSVPLWIALFIAYAFIDGYIAKSIAFSFKEHDESTFPETNVSSPRAVDQSRGIVHETMKISEVENEDAQAEKMYEKLLSKYVNHWGYQTGTRMLNDEIAAHRRRGDGFAEAVRKVYERQETS